MGLSDAASGGYMWIYVDIFHCEIEDKTSYKTMGCREVSHDVQANLLSVQASNNHLIFDSMISILSYPIPSCRSILLVGFRWGIPTMDCDNPECIG